MAQGPRGLAAFLFFLALSSTVRARQEVYVVKGTSVTGMDGLYAEEGQGSSAHYKRLGGADSWGGYYYLYRGTERRGAWVLGRGMTFETRRTHFRAPAGSAANQPPPFSGWKYVHDWTKDGKESGEDLGNVRVTRLQLDEKETAAGVFERGGGETVEGIICRRNSNYKGDVVCCLSVYVFGNKGSNILSHNQT